MGRGGMDVTPSEERSPPTAPDTVDTTQSPDPISKEQIAQIKRKLLPRETGHDIGMGSPVPLSAELVGVITRLRKMKDENEDWSRWRDVVFRGQKLNIDALEYKSPPNEDDSRKHLDVVNQAMKIDLIATGLKPNPDSVINPAFDPSAWTGQTETGTLYCKECYLPLYPDPDPEDLYIFLHAYRYTTESLGSFATRLPHWADKSWTWPKLKETV